MRTKMKLKTATDLLMSVALLLLMAYEQIGGQATHEWIGMGMFVLFILHHILNRKWIKNLFRGKYTALRVMQTVLAALVLISMLGSLISGIILSRLSACPWQRRLREDPAYAVSLLGICVYGPASGFPLEYDDGHGRKDGKDIIRCPKVGASCHCCLSCGIWRIRF